MGREYSQDKKPSRQAMIIRVPRIGSTKRSRKNDMKSKTRKTSLLGAIALTAALMTAQAAPTIITTGQGRGADLNIRGGDVHHGNNFGDHNVIRVRNTADLGNARKTYLRFDLATLPSPAQKATGAALALQIAPAEGHSPPDKIWTFNVSGLKDGIPGENWSERTVSWDNAPANDTVSPLDLTDDAAPLGTFTITGTGIAGKSVSFSSPQLLKFLQGDTNGKVTLIITRQEAGEGPDNDVMHIFASKENANYAPPSLAVAFNEEALPVAGAPQAAPAAPQAKPQAQAGPQTTPTTYPPTEPLPANAPSASEINAFWEADKKQMPPSGAVLFMGSSSIRMWDTLAKDFPEIPVINRGFGGSQIFESALYADRIAFPYKPKIIILCAGTNDLAYGNKNPQQVLQEFKDFVAKIHAGLPDTRIVYISINPTVARWNQEADILETNHLIEKWIFENNSPTQKLNFINSHAQVLTADGNPQPKLLRDDGLHFNAEGYKLWTSILKPRILALAALDGVTRLDAQATQ
jgi:lysophospholipase L1-like esterase